MSRITRVIGAAYRVANARLRLWRCRLGGLVTLDGAPRVNAAGTIEIGDRVAIRSRVATTELSAGPDATIRIGARSFINHGASLSARAGITIGENVQIAPHVVVMDSDFHAVGDLSNAGKRAPIVIEDDAWLAIRSTVLKGVTIGRGAVVAAGAVVVKDVPPYTVVAGVPAKVIRTLKGEGAPVASGDGAQSKLPSWTEPCPRAGGGGAGGGRTSGHEDTPYAVGLPPPTPPV
ncbi:MAG: acyltransferase [Bacteroidota bacterium]